MLTMSRFSLSLTKKGESSSSPKPKFPKSTFYLDHNVDYDDNPPMRSTRFSDPNLLESNYHHRDNHEDNYDPEEMSESMTDESYEISNMGGGSPGKSYSYEALNVFSRFRRDSYNISIHSGDFMDGQSDSSHQEVGDIPVISFPFRPNEVVIKVVRVAHRFAIGSKQTSGSIGCLTLTNCRLKFSSYLKEEDQQRQRSHSQSRLQQLQSSGSRQCPPLPSSMSQKTSLSLPPYNLHSFLEESSDLTLYDEDIDLMVAYRLEECKNFIHSSKTLLTVLCYDCRRVDFLLQEDDDGRSLIENLVKLLHPTSVSQTTSSLSSAVLSSPLHSSSSSGPQFRKVIDVPLFWYELAAQYPFFDRKDWEVSEGHWLSPVMSSDHRCQVKEGRNLLRISLCNEGNQLCHTLPPSFITLSSPLLSDITLMQSVSPQLPGQRVPIVTFALHVGSRRTRSSPSKTDSLRNQWNHQNLRSNKPSRTVSFMRETMHHFQLHNLQFHGHEKNNTRNSMPPSAFNSYHSSSFTDYHLLIRTVSLTEDISNLLRDKVRPVKIYDWNERLKGQSTIEKAHGKILEAVFSKSTSSFVSSVGKWMKLVSRILKFVFEIVHVLQHESSVILVEENDQLWNPIIATLVQVVLDERRRTLKGFEALLSKEFLFLGGSGGKWPDSMKTPISHVVFTLLIDSVHQLISFSSNGFAFEFTSLYLIQLFDRVYLPSPFQEERRFQGSRITTTSFEDLTRTDLSSQMRRMTVSKNSSVSRESFLPLSLEGMTIPQLMLIFNPLYDSTRVATTTNSRLRSSSIILSVPTHVAELQLFEGLFLRWSWSSDSRKSGAYYRRFPRLQEISFDQVLRSISLYQGRFVTSKGNSRKLITRRDNQSNVPPPVEIRETAL